MDIDFMKSSAEDQMEMMLMQMEKLPDYCNSYSYLNGIPLMDFNSIPGDTNYNDSVDNPSTFMSFNPSTLSYSNEAHQHPSAAHFQQPNEYGPSAALKRNSVAAMREMIFRIAAMQPIHIDPETVKPPKRRNVKISSDPQSVAARHRRERISERIRILQRLVPGGTKMDTASMLDEAIHYVKFLKSQVQSLERVAASRPPSAAVPEIGFPVLMSSGNYSPLQAGKGYHRPHHHHHQSSAQHLADA